MSTTDPYFDGYDRWMAEYEDAQEIGERADAYNAACAAYSKAKGVREANKEGLAYLKEEAARLSQDLWPRTRIALIARQLKTPVPAAPAQEPHHYDFELDDPDPMMDDYSKDAEDQDAWGEGYTLAGEKWGYL